MSVLGIVVGAVVLSAGLALVFLVLVAFGVAVRAIGHERMGLED